MVLLHEEKGGTPMEEIVLALACDFAARADSFSTPNGAWKG